MSDLKIREFRERAERGLVTPDLAVIERRGRARRHRNAAAAASGLVLVLAAGLGIADIALNSGDTASDPATSPSTTPGTSWDAGVRTALDQGEEVLQPGPSEVIYDGVAVRFDVPGQNWEWWGAGMGLRRTADNAANYGAAVFLLPQPSARLQPCSDDQAQALGVDPDKLIANVAPLLNLAHATVLQGPRVTSAFGTDAVHLRLQTNGTCRDGGDAPAQLRGVVTGANFLGNGSDADPGWGGQHVLDVWHVVIPGPEPTSMLVASWDLNGTSEHHDQKQALLDSLRITPS